MRRLGQLPAFVAASVVALAAASVVALAPGSPLAASCAGAGSNHAAIVVEHGDGSVASRCVAFDTASVSGEKLLASSGVAWSGQTFGGYGVAVCALDAEPAHYSTCPGRDDYWAVFVSRAGGDWQLATVGISTLTLADGDAEGFRYVPAAGDPAPPASPAGVCPATAAGSGATTTAASTAVGSATSPGASTAPPGLPSASVPPSTAPSGSSDPPGPGPDLGLLAAVAVAGGLALTAVFRVVVVGRRPT